MSIQDPTLQAIASYHMSPAEAFIGLMVLFLNLFLEIVEKGIPKDNSPISYKVIRTPKSAFEDVSVEEGHYLYVNYKGQDFRVHYLDEGQCDQIFMRSAM